jgi:hypothetical protein
MTEKERSCVHNEKDQPPKIPICYFCEKVTDEEHYCYGCKHYVCEDCDERGMDLPFGEHDVEDHQSTEEDRDEEEW